MTPLDAMKKALEALENCSVAFVDDDDLKESVTNLRTAIAELESAAPVAWMGVYNEHDLRDMRTVVMRYKEQFRSEPPDRMFPLFTHPSPNAGELDLLRTQVRELRLQRDEESKRLDYLDSLTKRTHEMRKKEYPVNSDMHFAKHVSLYLRNEYGHVVKEGYGSVREAIDMAMGE